MSDLMKYMRCNSNCLFNSDTMKDGNSIESGTNEDPVSAGSQDL